MDTIRDESAKQLKAKRRRQREAKLRRQLEREAADEHHPREGRRIGSSAKANGSSSIRDG
jgi:hypothetical protein